MRPCRFMISASFTRSGTPNGGCARIIRFTKRGHAVYAKINGILLDIEREWKEELGSKRFTQFKELLFHIWDGRLIR